MKRRSRTLLVAGAVAAGAGALAVPFAATDRPDPREVVRAHRAEAQRWLEDAARDSGVTSGVVTLRWRISAAGRATHVATDSTPGAEAAGACLDGRLQTWTFPAEAVGDAEFSWRFGTARPGETWLPEAWS